MIHYSRNDIQTAKKMDLLSFLHLHDPYELIHVAGNTYCTREHDSLKISNGKWCWFSRGIGGRSALDYLIKVKGIPFTEAVGMILGRAAEMPPVSHIQEDSHQPKEKNLLLPEPVEGRPERVIAYLTGRGIEERPAKPGAGQGRIKQALPLRGRACHQIRPSGRTERHAGHG